MYLHRTASMRPTVNQTTVGKIKGWDTIILWSLEIKAIVETLIRKVPFKVVDIFGEKLNYLHDVDSWLLWISVDNILEALVCQKWI